MKLTGLLAALRTSEVYSSLLHDLKNGTQESDFNIISSARPFLIAGLLQDWHEAVIVITATGRRAYNISEQLPVWLEEQKPVYRFAEPTPMFYDRLPWDKSVIQNRIAGLSSLASGGDTPAPVIVTSARALMHRTIPPTQFQEATRQIAVGNRIQPNSLIREWVEIGYEPVSTVIEAGTFSQRGGILDIFPLAREYPVRIEFFDDEIDSMRTFDPDSQRSINQIKAVSVVPAREVLPIHTPMIADRLADWFATFHDGDDLTTSPITDFESLRNGQSFPYLEQYLSYAYDEQASLLDYAPENALIIIEDIHAVQDTIESLTEDALENRDASIHTNILPPDMHLQHLDWGALVASMHNRKIVRLATSSTSPDSQPAITQHARLFTPESRFAGQLRLLTNHVQEVVNQDETIIIVSKQADRIADLWEEQGVTNYLPPIDEISVLPSGTNIHLIQGELQNGWVLHGDGQPIHLITDSEIFGWSRPEPRRRKSDTRRGKRLPERNYADWKVGDFVVHIDYGIGKFVGLGNRTVEGTDREYLLVEYDGTDRLFVPIHQSDRLTKWVGASDTPPALNKLGKQIDWIKRRSKAQQNAEEEARELLEIYARRENSTGFVYSPDGPWQHELEASFPYIETEDQLRVTREIKQDMEQSIPMDRLVCGDVGYGKTEVAIRAAFKAVTDGKQVIVVVPTTVLAQQHYETFTQRLKPFPVVVDALSRFRTKKQQEEIIQRLKDGSCDIIIGTHRLFSKDIELKNPGLLIIDEEQRFGVKHKEHFKKLRSQIDVLTLTATPIPRTLYMSLSGIRDISMIQTPPEERLPVITHVGNFDKKLARQAIIREIDHGGQIFVVHNRVQSIEVTREKFAELVPEAGIVVAHGQMSARQLENAIAAFGRGEYDILLATAIIENGIDMPNVNTLIVDRAELFGVSQLYQLRGRVGRGAQQAYAYFFHEGTRKLTEDARQRLETLAEYTELGAGLQISIRDLEIRGAGDILTTRQTGHVQYVGLHLYSQLLAQAVKKLKGISSEQITAIEEDRIIIDLPVPAYIPNTWIPDMALRLQIYRRIGNLQSQTEIEDLRIELQDRFGQLPTAVDGLLYQMQVKLLARSIRATSITKPRQHILIKLPYLASVDRNTLAEVLGEHVEISRVAVELAYDSEEWKWELIEILEQLHERFRESFESEAV